MSRAEAIIDRLHARFPRMLDLSLGRLRTLLGKLGNPQLRLPPVIHVAGTNGKGSTCAFMRAIAEAGGLRVHVYTSPHLVRFHERIRLAGALVDDGVLADALAEVERANGEAALSVFEAITATAFHLFAATPADLCLLEVGLGGRFDATNVVPRPVATAITSISIDHAEFLGPTLRHIAFEKAGIMRADVPCATGAQPAEVGDALALAARRAKAPLLARGAAWSIAPEPGGLRYRDLAATLDLPPPGLAGAHQVDNAGIALATLRASGLALPAAAWGAIARAEWPARMQRLAGRLAALLPAGWELYLDGGHNPGGGEALAAVLAGWSDRPTHLVVGMKKAKDTAHFLAPLLPRAASLWAVAEPGQHQALPVEAIVAASGGAARPGPRVADALAAIAAEGGPPASVLICGSLYLAGEVLKLDATPDPA